MCEKVSTIFPTGCARMFTNTRLYVLSDDALHALIDTFDGAT